MKRKISLGMVIVMLLLSLCGCTNSYEKTAKSAYDKFSRGDFDSMTPAEKAQIDGFLDWLDTQ